MHYKFVSCMVMVRHYYTNNIVMLMEKSFWTYTSQETIMYSLQCSLSLHC
jgi:hypothetical protein